MKGKRISAKKWKEKGNRMRNKLSKRREQRKKARHQDWQGKGKNEKVRKDKRKGEGGI